MEITILTADLTEQTVKKEGLETDKKALALALSLHDPSSIVFVPLEKRSASPGFIAVFTSLYDGKVTYLRGCSSVFSSLKDDGISALVIKGNARKLSYISLRRGEMSVMTCEQLRSHSHLHAFEILSEGNGEIMLAIGEAGEKCVYPAAVFSSDTGEYLGCTLGALFGMRNLKAIIVPESEIHVTDPPQVQKRIASSKALRNLRREGSSVLIRKAFSDGWIVSGGFSPLKDPRTLHLSGDELNRRTDSTEPACPECAVSCMRKNGKGSLCPGFMECMALGSALGFYSPDRIVRFTQACCLYGLSPSETGLLLSALKQCDDLPFTYPQLKNADEGEVMRIISLIGQKKGIGESVAKGFDRQLTLSGRPVTIDLRGALGECIFQLYGEGDSCWPDLILGLSKKYRAYDMGYAAAYIRVYTHAFMTLGTGHLYPVALVFEKLFRHTPDRLFFLKQALMSVKYDCFRAKELLAIGLESVKAYDEKRGPREEIPSLFTDWIREDGSELSGVRLLSGYDRAMAEIESIRSPSSDSE
ncbi:MAG: aldehyde ferredoxin oxidoreductase N-terminal domain-containing protein [Bullifex sp.]